MALVKATLSSEAGEMPSTEMLAEMGKSPELRDQEERQRAALDEQQ